MNRRGKFRRFFTVVNAGAPLRRRIAYVLLLQYTIYIDGIIGREFKKILKGRLNYEQSDKQSGQNRYIL
jgi:hypothetical protein